MALSEQQRRWIDEIAPGHKMTQSTPPLPQQMPSEEERTLAETLTKDIRERYADRLDDLTAAERDLIIRALAPFLPNSIEKLPDDALGRDLISAAKERDDARALIETLREALRDSERAMTYALGVIVEFGDLNGFRNVSNEELGKAVIEVAKGISASLDKARAALADGGKG